MYLECSSEFWKAPDWSNVLANLYTRLRFVRRFDESSRRKFYRYIAKERQLLEQAGVDAEYVRLICRHWSDTTKPERLAAIRRYEAEVSCRDHPVRRSLKSLPCDLPPEYRTKERMRAQWC